MAAHGSSGVRGHVLVVHSTREERRPPLLYVHKLLGACEHGPRGLRALRRAEHPPRADELRGLYPGSHMLRGEPEPMPAHGVAEP